MSILSDLQECINSAVIFVYNKPISGIRNQLTEIRWTKVWHRAWTVWIIPVMGSANERGLCNVRPSLVGWIHTHNDPWPRFFLTITHTCQYIRQLVIVIKTLDCVNGTTAITENYIEGVVQSILIDWISLSKYWYTVTEYCLVHIRFITCIVTFFHQSLHYKVWAIMEELAH